VTTMLPASSRLIARIRTMRKMRGMSQQQLAERITAAGYRIGRVGIANSEAGARKELPSDFAFAAATVFGVSVERLLSDVTCTACQDIPPVGFSCNICGTAS
jgi:transcriptional regulator with XRE-family HTH domain